MKYFDFHAHIVFKQLFAEVPNIDSKLDGKDVIGVADLCTDLSNILQTQIHQSQLAAFRDEVIVGIALYGLESAIAKEALKLRNNLRKRSRHKMWPTLFKAAYDVDANPLYATFDEFTLKRTVKNYLDAGHSFHVIDETNVNKAFPKDKVSIFFVVEGCHSLVNSSLEAPINNPNHKFPPQEILKNLDILLALAPVVSINPTHLQQSNLCNHAFGMQLTEVKPFFPRGNGLEDDGRTVIQGAFERSVHIDVKHMSYRSRRDLMKEIDNRKFANPMPLLCTHSGFTGVPFRDWINHVYDYRVTEGVVYVEIAKTQHMHNNPALPAPGFNMSTINLFDEEIVWIVKHGGVIGLSMDRRILGFMSMNDKDPAGTDPQSEFYVDREYISIGEWNNLFPQQPPHGNKVRDQECVTAVSIEAIEGGGTQPAKHEFYNRHVLLHLKHFLQVCIDAGIALTDAQNHITIGSDFDGVINPFSNMSTVEEMHELKEMVKKDFIPYLKSLKDSRVWASQLDVKIFAEKLFFENGKNFIRNFFKQ